VGLGSSITTDRGSLGSEAGVLTGGGFSVEIFSFSVLSVFSGFSVLSDFSVENFSVENLSVFFDFLGGILSVVSAFSVEILSISSVELLSSFSVFFRLTTQFFKGSFLIMRYFMFRFRFSKRDFILHC